MGSVLPQGFVNSLENAPGFRRDAFESVHASGDRTTSIRLNPHKPLQKLPFTNIRPVPWSRHGFYLEERPLFTVDPLFHAGAYYVQEASSMFIEQALVHAPALNRPLVALDLCAAPGGKSTHLLSLLPAGSLLLSNEIIKTRVPVLVENLTKWGSPDLVVTQNDPKDFSALENMFDLMLIDAPCSGSGLFRKDPAAMENWSTESVYHCSLRQQRILTDALPALRPGGMLIYSTCSFSVEEDESIVAWILEQGDMELLQVPVQEDWGVFVSGDEMNRPAYRFYPDRLAGEGFFMACFQKKGDHEIRTPVTKQKRGGGAALAPVIPSTWHLIKNWLSVPDEYGAFQWKDDYLLFPKNHMNILARVKEKLYIRKAGTRLGQLIRHDFLPDHELAMSYYVNRELPGMDLDTESALQFLRRQPFEVNQAAKGWQMVRYHGMALGWMKCMPGRVNNYYPKEWRILHV